MGTAERINKGVSKKRRAGGVTVGVEEAPETFYRYKGHHRVDECVKMGRDGVQCVSVCFYYIFSELVLVVSLFYDHVLVSVRMCGLTGLSNNLMRNACLHGRDKEL